MIDTDVMRLRHLRNAALRARALARALASNSRIDSAVFDRSAVLCWAIARFASGQLRAHPFLSYQKGPSRLRALSDHAVASMLALTARRSGRSFSALEAELQCVAREVDDTRALSRLPDLSDSLGRRQLQLRGLAKELEVRARSERGTVAVVGADAHVKGNAVGIAAQNDWPYLAI
jgi:hypothetical protein